MDRPRKKLAYGDKVDPISMEEFSALPPEQIIFLGEHCFYLPSIYNWIYNRDKITNPYTNLNFTDAELAELREVALRINPLKVVVVPLIHAAVEIDTTSLISVKKLFMDIMVAHGYAANGSFQGAIQKYLGSGIYLNTQIEDKSRFLSYHLNSSQDRQLADFGIRDDLRVYLMRMLSPHSIIEDYEQMRNVLVNNHYPTDAIDRVLQSMQTAIRENDEQSAGNE